LFGLRLPILVFREEGITGGVFDNGVSDVFVHPIPSPDITGTAKGALKQVFQRWAGKVREHYYDDKRAWSGLRELIRESQPVLPAAFAPAQTALPSTSITEGNES